MRKSGSTYSRMNNNCSGEKMAIIWVYSVKIKGNLAHLAEKNSQAGAKITTIQATIIHKKF